ncbi:MAG TPA: hypothetical protein PKE54_17745, partial [Candidatus Obscuribacter sp.]|nr:hypothetical protein [Candidatus Obscuribacter sp.]
TSARPSKDRIDEPWSHLEQTRKQAENTSGGHTLIRRSQRHLTGNRKYLRHARAEAVRGMTGQLLAENNQPLQAQV